MSATGDEAAFPQPMLDAGGQVNFPGNYGPHAGLTKREWLAGKIMAGFASDPSWTECATSKAARVAEIAVEWADALLAELEKAR